MRTILAGCAAFCLGIWLTSGGTAAAISPSAADGKPPRMEAWVTQLGSPSYARRENAARHLLRAGAEAIEPLTRGTEADDVEIRYRAERLLAILKQRDFQARLKAFASDLEGHQRLSLPGWERFGRIVGEGRGARRFFVEMQRAEPVLLEAYTNNLWEASRLLRARCEMYEKAMNNGLEYEDKDFSVPTVATLLLMAGDERVAVPEACDDQLYWLLWWTLYRQKLEAPLEADQFVLLLDLFGTWLGRPTDPASPLCFEKIRIALRYDRKEILPLCTEMLRQPDHQVQSSALVAIGALGDQGHLRHVEPLLANQEVIWRGIQTEIQLRDLALAVLVHLSGQQLDVYGFQYTPAEPGTLFVPGAQKSFYFLDSRARELALEKWRAWSLAEKQGIPPGGP